MQGMGSSGSGGGGGSSTPPIDLGLVVDAINNLLNLLAGVFYPGGSIAGTDYFTGGTTAFSPYANSKYVKKAIIQNLSSTDTLTLIFVQGGSGKVSLVVANQSITLNPAPSAAQGGGTLPVGNIDLGTMSAIFSTNSAQAMAVYWEQ